MIRLPTLPRAPLGALLGALLLAPLGFGQGNAPATWRALYQGELGELHVVVDLTLGDDGFAFARLTPAGAGVPGSGIRAGGMLDGVGTHDPEAGTLELTLHPARPGVASAAAIDYAYFAARQAADGAADAKAGGEAGAAAPEPAAGTLRGSRSLDWDDDGDTLTLTLDLEPTGAPRTGTLTRGAQYAFGRFTQGRIDLGFSYPRFRGGPFGLNDLLERRAAERLEGWLGDGRNVLEGEGGLGWAWTHHEAVDLVGAAGPYRSLLTSFYYYTGGAHPNSHGESLLVEAVGNDVRELTLSELFAPGAEWLAPVADVVLADLAAQGALWVVNGDVAALSTEDLATFVLGPAGLTFRFAPYAMGPYAQGGFAVTLPYPELLPLAAPGGALAAFAREYAAR